MSDIMQSWFDEIFKSNWIFQEMKKIEIGRFRNSESGKSGYWKKELDGWHVEETIFFKAVMVNKPLLVSSRFVCATVIQVNNRSRYAAVFTSLYVIVSTTSQFVNDELIIKMWMANMSTSYYLISDRLRLLSESFPRFAKVR